MADENGDTVEGEDRLFRRLALELSVEVAVANRAGRPHAYIMAKDVVAMARAFEDYLNEDAKAKEA